MKRKNPEPSQPPENTTAARPFYYARVPGQQDGFYAAKHLCRGDVYWFVSLDGQWWVEADGDPRSLTRPHVERLFNPGFWRPTPMATRFIRRHGHLEVFEPRTPIADDQRPA